MDNFIWFFYVLHSAHTHRADIHSEKWIHTSVIIALLITRLWAKEIEKCSRKMFWMLIKLWLLKMKWRKNNNDGIENMRVMMRIYLFVASVTIRRSAGFLTGQWWRRHFKLITCHLLSKQTECVASRHSVQCVFCVENVFYAVRVSLLWRKNICSSRRCLTSKYYSSSFQLNKYPGWHTHTCT